MLDQKIADELAEQYTVLWDFRGWFHPYWTTPDPVTAAHYMETEASEALDAWVKVQNPHHARNNPADKNNVADECADILMMALTAMTAPPTVWRLPVESDVGIVQLKKHVFRAWSAVVSGANGSLDIFHLRNAAVMAYMNILEHGGGAITMRQRLRRIFYKHWGLDGLPSPVAYAREAVDSGCTLYEWDRIYMKRLSKDEAEMTSLLVLPALNTLEIAAL